MWIKFQVIYKTFIGQELMLVGSIDRLEPVTGKMQCRWSLKMPKTGLWSYELEYSSPEKFSYRYFVNDSNFSVNIDEWGPDRIFSPENRLKSRILL